VIVLVDGLKIVFKVRGMLVQHAGATVPLLVIAHYSHRYSYASHLLLSLLLSSDI
jgi:hypothetical protein